MNKNIKLEKFKKKREEIWVKYSDTGIIDKDKYIIILHEGIKDMEQLIKDFEK